MMSIEAKKERYYALKHAMQSGVAQLLAMGSKMATAKHLRVGVNVALCDQAALVKLLEKKGLFTREEYLDALIEVAEEEVARYEKELSERMGAKVTLR